MARQDKILLESDLIDLIRAKGKISVEEAAKIFDVKKETIQKMADSLVNSNILGVEYKFTTPYLYLNEEKNSNIPNEKGGEYINKFDFNVKNRNYLDASENLKNIISDFCNADSIHNLKILLQLSTINKELKANLESINPYSSNLIMGLIKKCRGFLEQGNLTKAKETYKESVELYKIFPDDFYERKSELAMEMAELNHRINANVLKLLSSNVNLISKQITELIKRGEDYLNKNDFVSVNNIIKRCIELCDKIPKSFFKRKLELLISIFELYKKQALKQSIQRLQNEIGK